MGLNTNVQEPIFAEKMPDIADFMTTEEAAEFMGFHQVSVRRLLREKQIEGLKWGKEWLISRKSVKDYLTRYAGYSKFDPRRSNK